MYKHPVVAVDGSETSINALKHAAELAGVNSARLTLVHVANPAEYMALAPEFLQHESYEAAAVAQGNEVLDAAERTARELGVENTVKHLLVANRVRVKWRRIWLIMPMKTVPTCWCWVRTDVPD